MYQKIVIKSKVDKYSQNNNENDSKKIKTKKNPIQIQATRQCESCSLYFETFTWSFEKKN